MTRLDRLSETIGCDVVTHREGAQVGGVADVFFDIGSKSISGMTLKSKRFGDESWFGVAEIETLGKDVILIKGEASLIQTKKGLLGDETSFAAARQLGATKGKSLKDLKGMQVVTVDGELLGTLEDVDVRGRTRTISELHLSNHLRLPVSSADIEIGHDEIIVPTACSMRLREEDKAAKGFLSRIFTENKKADAKMNHPK